MFLEGSFEPEIAKEDKNEETAFLLNTFGAHWDPELVEMTLPGFPKNINF